MAGSRDCFVLKGLKGTAASVVGSLRQSMSGQKILIAATTNGALSLCQTLFYRFILHLTFPFRSPVGQALPLLPLTDTQRGAKMCLYQAAWYTREAQNAELLTASCAPPITWSDGDTGAEFPGTSCEQRT